VYGSDEVRALGPVLFIVAAAIAVALAAPIPVLTIGYGTRQATFWLDEDQTYVLSYVSSLYGAPVEELHYRKGDRLMVASVRSPDIRAVEYFRWESRIYQLDDKYVQFAPPNGVARLSIQVTPAYQLRIATAHRAIDLGEVFGETRVEVAPQRLPVLTALLFGWRP